MSDDTPTAETPTAGEPEQAPAAPPEQPAAAEQPTQDSFDAEYVKKLRRENAEWRTKARHNEEAAKRLAEIEEANKTEAQKQAEQLQTLQQENERLRIQALTAQVAQAKGVPANLLRGSTQEELEAFADEILSFRGNTPPPDFGAGKRGDETGVKQLSKADLNTMTAEQIEQARLNGQLEDLLNPTRR